MRTKTDTILTDWSQVRTLPSLLQNRIPHETYLIFTKTSRFITFIRLKCVIDKHNHIKYTQPTNWYMDYAVLSTSRKSFQTNHSNATPIQECYDKMINNKDECV